MNEAAARVLLVYGYEPSGHAAAAFALEEALRARGAIATRVQVASSHHPKAGLAVARAYHALLRAAPSVWGSLYSSDLSRKSLNFLRGAYLDLGGYEKLLEAVRGHGADIIVCPQGAVATVFAEARRRGRLDVPVVSVLTDFDLHPLWLEPPADYFIVPTMEAAQSLVAGAVETERIRVLGIPIHSAFSNAPECSQARRILALPASAPVVLVSGGSHGHGEIERHCGALLRRLPRAILLVLCGANESLRRVMSRETDRVRCFGPQPAQFVATLLAAADVHLAKAGGLSTAESLAVGVPLVLMNPLPGQESANARILRRLDAATVGSNSTECVDLVATAFLGSSRRDAASRAQMRLSKPTSAQDAAGFILEMTYPRSPRATGISL